MEDGAPSRREQDGVPSHRQRGKKRVPHLNGQRPDHRVRLHPNKMAPKNPVRRSPTNHGSIHGLQPTVGLKHRQLVKPLSRHRRHVLSRLRLPDSPPAPRTIPLSRRLPLQGRHRWHMVVTPVMALVRFHLRPRDGATDTRAMALPQDPMAVQVVATAAGGLGAI